ncbi:MAG: di-trans,poly-cis-decaprenylcistransferase [Candidatus Roizmanbacteria bacterium]|nr:MAG: di-trans,poly-cis-decaprenylcistransferase [Candidatus Roizmanbacteria bacterium]
MVNKYEGRIYSPSKIDLVREINNAQNPIEVLVSKEGLTLPKSVLVIADGNGRWAQEHGLPVTEGHRQGAEALKNILRNFRLLPAINTVVIWALSPDNIKKRPVEEIRGIMEVMIESLKSTEEELVAGNGRFIHLGERAGLHQALLNAIDNATTVTANNMGQKVAVAINYDGQQEYLRGIQRYIEAKKQSGEIDSVISMLPSDLEKEAMKFIDPEGVGEIELMIRTGGEKRTSKFGWRINGAEHSFPQVFLPEFGARDLAISLADFSFRDRRFGGRPNVS